MKKEIERNGWYTLEAFFEENLGWSDGEKGEKNKREKVRVANPNRHGIARWDRKRMKWEWELLRKLTELCVLYSERFVLTLFLSVLWVNLVIYVDVAYVDNMWQILAIEWVPRRGRLSLVLCGIVLLGVSVTVGIVHVNGTRDIYGIAIGLLCLHFWEVFELFNTMMIW